jgi:hypothetical protein
LLGNALMYQLIHQQRADFLRKSADAGIPASTKIENMIGQRADLISEDVAGPHVRSLARHRLVYWNFSNHATARAPKLCPQTKLRSRSKHEEGIRCCRNPVVRRIRRS